MPRPALPTPPAAVIGPPLPWWRFAMVWFMLSGPAFVVIAGFATLAIALRHPDVELHEVPARPAAAKTAGPALHASTLQPGAAATPAGH